MGENILHELIVKLTVDEHGFVNGLKHSLLSAESWKKQMVPSMKGIDQAFGSIIKTATHLTEGIAVLGLALGEELVRDSMKSIDAMAKLSDKTGINIESMYGLKVAADAVHVSIDQVARTIQKLQKNIGEAASDPHGDLAQKFKDIGLSVSELRDMKPEEAFGKIADALNSMPDRTAAAAAGVKLLGRSSQELNNFIHLGSKGMEEAAEEAKKLGLAVNRVDAAKVEITKKAFLDLKTGIEGVGNRLTVALTPYLYAAAEAMTAFLTEGDKCQGVINGIVDAGVTGFKYVSNAIHIVEIGFSALWLAAASLSKSFYEVLAAGSYAFQYIGGLGDNLDTLFGAMADNIGATFEIVWSATKLGVSKFVSFVGDQLVTLINQLAKAAGFFDNDLMVSMQDAAFTIQRTVGGAAALTSKQFDDTVEKAAKTGEALKDAFSNVLDVKVDNSMFDELADNADKQFEKAHDDFTTLWDEPWPSDSVDEWVDHAVEKLQKLAEAKAAAAPGNQDNGGPPEIKDAAWEAYKKALDKHLEDVAMDQIYWEKSKNEQIELMTQEHSQDIERAEAAEIARVNALRKQGFKGQIALTQEVLGTLSTLMESHNRKAFELGKIAAIANAIINTAEGATKALAQGGFYGIAMAGAVIAAGAVQIAQIKSTSFSGGGSGGNSGGGSSNTSPAAADTSSNSATSPGAKPANNVSITLIGDSFGQKQMRSLVDQLSDAAGDGAIIRVHGR